MSIDIGLVKLKARADNLFNHKRYSYALDNYITLTKKLGTDKDDNQFIADCYYNMALCAWHCNEYLVALNAVLFSLKLQNNKTCEAEKTLFMNILMKLNKVEDLNVFLQKFGEDLSVECQWLGQLFVSAKGDFDIMIKVLVSHPSIDPALSQNEKIAQAIKKLGPPQDNKLTQITESSSASQREKQTRQSCSLL